MDHSWRPRPPIQGNICPTCSISHFPFCPPPHHSFNENRRFQSHNEYFFQRPPFDPFLDHRGPTVNPTRPFVGNPSDGFGDPRPWHRNPSLDRDTYSQFQGQSQIGDSDIVNRDYCRDGFGPPNYDHSSVGGYKRMRVDGMGENHASSSRILSEDDRRLKLIREHGIVPSGPAQGGVNLVSDFDCETMGYMREHSVLNKSFGKMDGEEYGMYNELRGGRNDMTLKPISNVGMNDFQSPGIGSFDRKGSSFDMELGFYMNKYRDEHGLALGQQYMRSNRNEELEQSHYGKVENSLTYSLHDNGRRSYLDHFPVVEQTQLSLDEVAPYRGGNPYNSNTRDGYISVSPKDDLKQTTFMSQSVHYPIPEVPYENYQNHTFRRIHSSDPVSTKEPHYSHPTDWQEMLGSNTLYHEQRSIATMDDRNLNNQLPRLYTKQNHMQLNHDFHSASQLSDMRRSVGVNTPSDDGLQGPVGHRNFRVLSPRARQYLEEEAGYPPMATGSDVGPTHASRVFNLQPPLPASPPPPLPLDPPGHPYSEPLASSSPPKAPSSLFPIAVSSSANVPSLYPSAPEAHLLAQTYYTNKPQLHASTGFSNEARQGLAEKYLGEGQTFPLRHFSSDEPKIVDAFHIFKQPHRATRPDHMVIILRGLPGSGKSYLAKMLRDLEVENGGNAPRIHSMDDYFMTEVEKVEESEVSKSSGSVRGKKPATKKVMEYCYEPEMEEAYRSSMLKAFKKTIDEGVFSFIIVDDRNLRVADFAQFWATAKRSGYEVYLLEATYKDPAGCAARNVHGFSQDDIEKMAGQWEEAPSLYLKLDVKSLLHGDGFEESGIQEVDMDTEDGDPAGSLSGSEERNPENVIVPSVEDFKSNGPSKDYKRWDAEGGHPVEEVKELRRSKWSDDLDEDDAERTEGIKGNSSALSGLIQAYSKEGKSVSWGDQVGNTGFSIGASKKAKVLSLVIGPGFGYNLKSNPLPEENLISAPNTGESKKRNIFQEQLRAERESFKAVFDKRRQRISGLDVDED